MDEVKPPRWNMDIMTSRKCASCGYEWIQPSEIGKCPKCSSDQIINFDSRINQLARI